MLSPSSQKREEYLRKKRNRKLLRYGLFIFFTALVVSAIAYIAHRPQFRISKVELNGQVLVSSAEVQDASLAYISGSYLWFFPKNNFLLYPKDALAEYLKATFERIDTIQIHRAGLTTLVVDITERKPEAMWCDGTPTDSDMSGQNCYFMDSNSTIFAPAPQFSGDAYFKYYGLVGTSTPIGADYIASTTEFADMTKFIDSVKALSLNPLYIIATGEGQFSMVLSSGAQIYFDTKEPLSEVTQNLALLLRTSTLATSSVQNLPIDYIDLRFGNKLYYKLK